MMIEMMLKERAIIRKTTIAHAHFSVITEFFVDGISFSDRPNKLEDLIPK